MRREIQGNTPPSIRAVCEKQSGLEVPEEREALRARERLLRGLQAEELLRETRERFGVVEIADVGDRLAELHAEAFVQRGFLVEREHARAERRAPLDRVVGRLVHVLDQLAHL